MTGPLTATTVARLRSVVLKCLADEPDALVVDLSRVGKFEDAALMVFPALARAAAAWPAVPLILHSTSPHLRDRLEALGVTRTVSVVADEAAAQVQARHGRGPARVTEDLLGQPDALGRARHVVREVCRRHGWGQIEDHAETVAGELVANALRHGVRPASVTVSATPYHLHVAVRDRSAVLPRVCDGDGEQGRGLRIVEALSTAWGSTPTADGKVVWATVRVPTPANP